VDSYTRHLFYSLGNNAGVNWIGSCEYLTEILDVVTKKKSLPQSGIKPRFFYLPTRSLVFVLTAISVLLCLEEHIIKYIYT
jgi:hypothetical protein